MISAPRALKLFSLVLAGCLAGSGWWLSSGDRAADAQQADRSFAAQPVDDDMHHFMEYVFQPNYLRLKSGLAAAPKDAAAWKGVKGDSLTLAECANLLLTRAPDEDGEAWREMSVTVRKHGSELYQAARKSDYDAARKAYVVMLENCNACHQKFAEGEHQLEP